MRYLISALAALLATSVFAIPTEVSAQEEPPPPPPPVEEVEPSTETLSDPTVPASPQAVEGEFEADAEAEPSRSVEPFSAARGSVEALTGLGLMLGGSLSGLLGGFVVGSIASGPGTAGAGVAAGVGGLLGYTIGTPVGVWLGGNAMAGNGSIWSTAGGFLGGVLAGGATTLIVSAGTGTNGGAFIWMTTMPVAGAIIGYELSSGPASDSGGLTLQLGASPTPSGQGTLFNLSGRW
jgi:hypothetical protein